jgi:hypothetical protein
MTTCRVQEATGLPDTPRIHGNWAWGNFFRDANETAVAAFGHEL